MIKYSGYDSKNIFIVVVVEVLSVYSASVSNLTLTFLF
jgi:hypothetical protein